MEIMLPTRIVSGDMDLDQEAEALYAMANGSGKLVTKENYSSCKYGVRIIDATSPGKIKTALLKLFHYIQESNRRDNLFFTDLTCFVQAYDPEYLTTFEKRLFFSKGKFC